MAEEKLMDETKTVLSEQRARSASYYWGNGLYTDFEKAYGKYLFVPFDLPIIAPNDKGKFVKFYFEKSTNATKVKTDLLSLQFDGSDYSPYRTITSVSRGGHSDVWSANQVPEIYTEFPEIFEQIHEYMPFIEEKDFRWSMWSSNWDVPAHRDYGSQIDAPVGIRIKLFDNNPEETLYMKVDPLEWETDNFDVTYTLPIPKDTNSFAWNNLRQKHASRYNKGGYRKILMIVSARELGRCITGKNLNKYVDLLDRSVAKYQKETVVDQWTNFTDYLTIKESDPINMVLDQR